MMIDSVMHYLIFAIVMFFSAFINGLTGFGFVVMSLPILVLLGFDSKNLVGMFLYLSLFLNLYLLFHFKQAVKKTPKPFYLLIGGLLAIYPGMYVLSFIDTSSFKRLLGIIIIFLAFLIVFNFRFTVKKPRTYLLTVGFLTGFIQSLFAISGPFLIFCLKQKQEELPIFKARLIIFYFMINILLVYGFIQSEMLNLKHIPSISLLLIPVFLGVFLGTRMAKFLPEKRYFKLVVGMLLMMGLSIIFIK